jgi:hypothetical protein
MTVSTAQYTVEQTASLVEKFTAGATVEALATEFGKSVRSVIAKLSREGVYKAKEKASTATAVRKAQLVEAIAAKTGATVEQVESLEKATKEALELVLKALA